MQATSSSGIRGFLGRKKHTQQQAAPAEPSAESSPPSHTSSSNVSAEAAAAAAAQEASQGSEDATPRVAMEGPLKKRGAKMPVMHDRYCVATWELDAQERKCVMLRSYKSRKAYDAHPERPASVHPLKCISEWDGKTGFHRHAHAFSMETHDKKVFQCVAPSAADKDKWVELMALQTAFTTAQPNSRDVRLGSVGTLVPLRRTTSVESGAATKPRAYTSASTGAKTRGMSCADAGSTDSEGQGGALGHGHDGLFRSTSGASSGSMEFTGSGKTGEPADWGLYGDANDASASKSHYDVGDEDDDKNLLLDKDLLDARGAKSSGTLANDAYLFEDAGVSRFGAVVVQGTAQSDEDGDEFVDEELAARQAREKSERQMRRRAQKLESNKDLYAEMAAARLNDMRKHARQPPKRPSESHESESEGDAMEAPDVAPLQDVASSRRSSSRSRRSSKPHKRSSVSSERESSERGERSEEEEEEEELEPESLLLAGLSEAERLEAEELRQLKKQHKAERRAKRREQRQKQEEERAALQAAELARRHREEQREREAAKALEEQEKRDRKERREMKDKLKREKARQRQAEAELRQLVELKQAEEDKRRRKEKETKEAKKEAKKTKRKEKYTPPADRIHKKEERAAAAASASATASTTDVSNALVVVDKPEETKEAPAPTPTTAPTPTAAPTAAPVSAPTPAPVPSKAPKSAPTEAPAPQSAAPMAVPPHSMPMYQVTPPPFMPAYPSAPVSMPAYGLAQTFGAYAMPYGTMGMGAPMAAQQAFARPPLGFMAGLSMGACSPPASPAKEATVERMIGPQLPTEEERKAADKTATATSGAKLTNLPDLPDVEEF